MKTISAGLEAHLAQTTTSICRIVLMLTRWRRVHVSGITQASQAVVTTTEEHALTTGSYVALQGVEGMTEINDDAHTGWLMSPVTVLSATTFRLDDIDSTAFTAYTSGGSIFLCFGWTDLDVDITYRNMLYRAEASYTPSSTKTGNTMSSDAVELDGILDETYFALPNVSEGYIRSGLYDYSEIRFAKIGYGFATLPAGDTGSTTVFALTNPGAETGDTTGWTPTGGSGAAITAATSGWHSTTPRTGSYFFKMYGISNNNVCAAYQDIDVSSLATEIDSGACHASWELYLNTADIATGPDLGGMRLEFYNSGMSLISLAEVGLTTYGADANTTWNKISIDQESIPANTRTIRVLMRTHMGKVGSTINAYFDDLSDLTVVYAPSSSQTYTITNPGAETGDATGWTVTGAGGSTLTAVTSAWYSTTPHAGTYFFHLNGTSTGVHYAYQDLDVSAQASSIDAGSCRVSWGAMANSPDLTAPDPLGIRLEFYNSGASLISYEEVPLKQYGLHQNTDWYRHSLGNKTVPSGTRTIRAIIRGEKPAAGTSLQNHWDSIEDVTVRTLSAATTSGESGPWGEEEDGILWMLRGFTGEFTTTGDRYLAEIRSLWRIAERNFLSVYTRSCRWDGIEDPRCGVNVANHTFSDSVGVVYSQKKFDNTLSGTGTVWDDDYFKWGYLRWTSGSNSGLEQQVMAYKSGAWTLWDDAPFTISPGDQFTVVAGCDGLLSTCIDVYNNKLNHGGFPYLPGEDVLIQTVTAKKTEVSS